MVGATLIDAYLGDHGDNPESYDDMPTEALHMAHCCNAFLNAVQGLVLDVFVAEKIFGNMTSRSRWEIFGNGSHWHGDCALTKGPSTEIKVAQT